MRPLLLSAALVAGSAAAQPFVVEDLRVSSSTTNRFDLVIVGDGYRTQDQVQLTADANRALNLLFSASPFQQFASLFNVRLIHAISVDNGADQGTYGATRNTRYDARYFCNGIERLLCVSTSTVFSDVWAHTSGTDAILVLVNDPKYGGSGGSVMTASVNSASGEIFTHEIGHVVGRLADEYEDPYPGFPACNPVSDCTEANMTVRTTRADVKWEPWIGSATPVPTPEGVGHTGVGVFEGGRYVSAGVYRPVETACRMRTFGRGFCPVCTEQLARSFLGIMRGIDTQSPTSSVVTYCPGQPPQFRVGLLPSPGTWTTEWLVSGAPAGTGTMFTPPLSATGTYSVRAVATWSSPLIRRPTPVQSQVSWTVTPDPACGADGGVVPGPDAGVADAGLDAGMRDGGPVDAGVLDAGRPLDAGQTVDSGTPLDSGIMSDAGPSLDAGARVDAGQSLDAGAPPDAGLLVDAGQSLDAGALLDAGTLVDAGHSHDAGDPSDAGEVDAGTTDGGPLADAGSADAGAELDAGLLADAGADAGDADSNAGPATRLEDEVVLPTTPLPVTGGCGCSSASTAQLLFGALLLLVRRRRLTA